MISLHVPQNLFNMSILFERKVKKQKREGGLRHIPHIYYLTGFTYFIPSLHQASKWVNNRDRQVNATHVVHKLQNLT